jgi:hypothetical protein
MACIKGLPSARDEKTGSGLMAVKAKTVRHGDAGQLMTTGTA